MNLKELMVLKASQNKAKTEGANAEVTTKEKVEDKAEEIVSAPTISAPAQKLSIQDKIKALQEAARQRALGGEASPVPASSLKAANELSHVVKNHSVISVEGKDYTLAELLVKIAGLKKIAQVNKAFEKKLSMFMMAAEELEELTSSYIEKTVEVKKAEDNKPVVSQVSYVVAEALKQSPAAGTDIILNAEQLLARDMALEGKSFCLIGPAGSGKTTAQRAVAQALLDQDKLHTCYFKVQGSGERVAAPSFVACAYTRRASGNLAKAIHKDPHLARVLSNNIMTIHALLEFEPVFMIDPITNKETMRFLPQRTSKNPLDISHLVIEESSMVGIDLATLLYDALPDNVQIIYIGDINQLPPVFGASILNYGLVQMPVVELTKVYRQEGDSGILANAHNILKGKMVEAAKDCFLVEGKSPTEVGAEKTAMALAKMFEIWFNNGTYDPLEDVILTPFNKQALGTIEMNNHIAQFLGVARQAVVHEVIAGFNKLYLAVGDRVMIDKQDGYISHIILNPDYMGQVPQAPGVDLSRYGVRVAGLGKSEADLFELEYDYSNLDIDKMLEEEGERKVQCSHVVTAVLESGRTVQCSSAGDFSPASFSLGYCLTVHKAQGCEFRKVFGIMHKSHSVMAFRELLYTMWTRSKQEMYLIAKKWIVEKAIKNPRIKGDSLKEKIAFFNKDMNLQGGFKCLR